MRFKKLLNHTRPLNPLLRIVTVALLLALSACAVQIKDEQFCSLIINPDDFSIITVACDNFLSSNPQTLTGQQWLSQVVASEASGIAPECTTSQALADMKAEVEKLCSEQKCDDQTQAMVTNLVNGLTKIHAKAQQALLVIPIH
jgi:hypothetical protein